MTLHTTAYGPADDPAASQIVFLHGLFGQGRNWTGVAKALTTSPPSGHRCLLVDLPHHGRSDWAERFDYVEVADEVAGLLSADDPVTLVGHSLGGKAAMVLALRHPDVVRRLCVVDISPVDHEGSDEFAGYIRAMKALDLAHLARRDDADAALTPAVPVQSVRDFLLQNLRREGDHWRWQANLDVLARDLDTIAGWPADDVAALPPYDGPVLWIAGSESAYVKPEHTAVMERMFPRVRKVTIKGAGHWVHSQRPEVFVEVLRRFAADKASRG